MNYIALIVLAVSSVFTHLSYIHPDAPCLGGVQSQAASPRDSEAVNRCDFAAYKGRIMRGRISAIRKPVPEYPSEAKRQRVEGDVIVKLLVDKEGNVVAACAIEGSELLTPAALKAATAAKFVKDFGSKRLAAKYDYNVHVVTYPFVLR